MTHNNIVVPLPYKYNNGGRDTTTHGKKLAGDCVTRAIAIATGIPYNTVHADMTRLQGVLHHNTRVCKRGKKQPHADNGINKKVYRDYLQKRGWTFVATMGIGTGCTTHLRTGEMPDGTIIARVSKHLCTIVDGVIQDTHNPARNGTRCVYGYFTQNPPQKAQ